MSKSEEKTKICIMCKKVLIKNYGAEPGDVLEEKYWRWMTIGSELVKIAKENNALEYSLCPECKKKDEEIEGKIVNEGMLGLA